MAAITINIDNEANKAFRKAVARKIGRGKEILGQAVEEEIIHWTRE